MGAIGRFFAPSKCRRGGLVVRCAVGNPVVCGSVALLRIAGRFALVANRPLAAPRVRARPHFATCARPCAPAGDLPANGLGHFKRLPPCGDGRSRPLSAQQKALAAVPFQCGLYPSAQGAAEFLTGQDVARPSAEFPLGPDAPLNIVPGVRQRGRDILLAVFSLQRFKSAVTPCRRV